MSSAAPRPDTSKDMADHVEQRIHVTAGAAEPMTVVLLPGQPLGPISVGTMGVWRVVAQDVDEEHAFVYYDGATLFIQSVDLGRPAMVNGQPCPTDWVGVPGESVISIGGAHLWYGDPNAQASAEPEEPAPQSQTQVRPELAPERGPLERSGPLARPFPPGAFVTEDSGVTRMQPIEEVAARIGRRVPTPPTGGATIQMAATNPSVILQQAQASAQGQVQIDAPPPPPPPPAPPMIPPAPMSAAPPAAPAGRAPVAPPPASAADNALERFKSQWRDASPPRKAIMVLAAPVLVAVGIIFFYSPTPASDPQPNLPTSASPAMASAAPSATTTEPPTTELAPAFTSGPIVPPVVTVAPPAPSASGTPTASSATPAAKKTLQRAAADAVAAGAYLEAAALYEQLALENPEVPAYKEAARIMRAKAAEKP